MVLSKQIPHFPMPVGPETVSPSEENSESGPRQDGCAHSDQMEFASSRENPTGQNKQNDGNV